MDNNIKFNIIRSLMQAFLSGMVIVLLTFLMYELTQSMFISLFVFVGLSLGTLKIILLLADRMEEERKHEQ